MSEQLSVSASTAGTWLTSAGWSGNTSLSLVIPLNSPLIGQGDDGEGSQQVRAGVVQEHGHHRQQRHQRGDDPQSERAGDTRL